MKIWVYFGLLCWLSQGLLLQGAQAAVKHKAVGAKKSSPAKHVSSKIVGRPKASQVRKASSRKIGASRSRHTTAKAQPARQAAPSSDRYKEIQEALVAKGYMTTPPNGQWDQNSQDAMRKFQADQNLSVSGKLSSRSIIALGLGSPSAAVPPASAAPVPVNTPAIPPKQ
jgi:hypothetical protein